MTSEQSNFRHAQEKYTSALRLFSIELSLHARLGVLHDLTASPRMREERTSL